VLQNVATNETTSTIAGIMVSDIFTVNSGHKKNKKKLARSFNFTFRYIDDVLSINNSRFGDFVDRICPIELEIKDTTDTDRSASYLDLPTPQN